MFYLHRIGSSNGNRYFVASQGLFEICNNLPTCLPNIPNLDDMYSHYKAANGYRYRHLINQPMKEP